MPGLLGLNFKNLTIMKNFRFYLEYSSPSQKRKDTRISLKNHSGNVIAVPLDEKNNFLYCGNSLNVECYSAVFYAKNSPVCGSSASREYLFKNCKRISEKQAREIHPNLFYYLNE